MLNSYIMLKDNVILATLFSLLMSYFEQFCFVSNKIKLNPCRYPVFAFGFFVWILEFRVVHIGTFIFMSDVDRVIVSVLFVFLLGLLSCCNFASLMPPFYLLYIVFFSQLFASLFESYHNCAGFGFFLAFQLVKEWVLYDCYTLLDCGLWLLSFNYNL